MFVTACSSVDMRLRRRAIMSLRRYALAFVGLLLVAGWLGVAPARASSCVENLSTSMVTCTFSSTGGEQTFPVPAGVSSIMVQAVGAPGGKLTDPNFGLVPGGSGAVVTGRLMVTARETLYAEVGGAGSDYGSYGKPGFNGGGQGSYFAAGGGGASDVRTSPRSTGLSHDTRLLIAGGGGGAGAASYNPHPDTAGGHGGSAGAAGGTANGADFDLTGGGGGAPGSATQGGAGGQGGIPGSACADNLDPPGCTTGDHGTAGALGVGGAGGTGGVTAPPGGGGGGGGGGLYGGGGGGVGAFGSRDSIDATGPGGGGGGGSSRVSAGGSVTPNTGSLPPEVMISYTAPAGLGAPPSIPRLHLAIAGPRAVTAGKFANFRITLSRSGPRLPIRNVRVMSRYAGHPLHHWNVATLPFGHSRKLHLTVRIPSSARGRFCITTTASARHARGASGRDCVNLATEEGE
jgi:hypothetical protein